jgi:hypothetical protein
MATSAPGTNRNEPVRKLPIYRAGGSAQPTFVALRAKELDIAREVEAMSLEELRRWPLLSANAKTSVSLDLPIGHTCDPTPTCAQVCYAAGPRAAATWRKSLRKRLRNLRYFQLEEPQAAAWKLGREFQRVRRRWEPRARLDYLRVNGSGDLFPELVPVLNFFASYYAGVRLWIVTRRPELAAQIAPRPNVFLQLSLDASTPSDLVERSRFLAETHPRAYLSFLRTKPDDDIKGAAIVFNEKRTEGLPYRGLTDCPVDAGRLPLDNVRGVGGTACSKCRKCFSEKTVERQKIGLGVHTPSPSRGA